MSTFRSTPLSADVSAAPQLAPADLRDVAAAGFRSVVNNRPDHEAPGQPAHTEIEAEARAAGLLDEIADGADDSWHELEGSNGAVANGHAGRGAAPPSVAAVVDALRRRTVRR